MNELERKLRREYDSMLNELFRKWSMLDELFRKWADYQEKEQLGIDPMCEAIENVIDAEVADFYQEYMEESE